MESELLDMRKGLLLVHRDDVKAGLSKPMAALSF